MLKSFVQYNGNLKRNYITKRVKVRILAGFVVCRPIELLAKCLSQKIDGMKRTMCPHCSQSPRFLLCKQ